MSTGRGTGRGRGTGPNTRGNGRGVGNAPTPTQSAGEPIKDQKLHYTEIIKEIKSLGGIIKGDFAVTGENSPKTIIDSLLSLQTIVQQISADLQKKEKDDAGVKAAEQSRKVAQSSKNKPKNQTQNTKNTSQGPVSSKTTPATQGSSLNKGNNDLYTQIQKLDSDLNACKMENKDLKTKLDSLCLEIGTPNGKQQSSNDCVQLLLEEKKKMSTVLESLDIMRNAKSNAESSDTKTQDQINKRKVLDRVNKQNDENKTSRMTVVHIFGSFQDKLPHIESAVTNGRQLDHVLNGIDIINGVESSTHGNQKVNKKDIDDKLQMFKERQDNCKWQLEEVEKFLDSIIKHDKEQKGKNNTAPESMDEKLQKLKDMHEQMRNDLKYMVRSLEFSANNTGSPKIQTVQDAVKTDDRSPKTNSKKKINGKGSEKVQHEGDKRDSTSTEKTFEDLKKDFDEAHKRLIEQLYGLQEKCRNIDRFKEHVNLKLKETVQSVTAMCEKKKPIEVKLEKNPGDETTSQYNEGLLQLLECVRRISDEKNTHEQIKKLKEENESLQTRLSKVAGIKLTEGNSSIANLGDPNRQMKVGEMYSELYDNEWTDLMDKLEAEKQKPDVEDKILQALCATLETCYNHCGVLNNKLKDYEEKIAELLIFDKMTTNEIKGYRKNTLERLESHIEVVRTDSKFQKEMEKELGLKKDALQIVLSSPFFKKCFRICWLMVVLHQPPMVIEMAGKDINKEKFREYTKSGKKVVFTVWPALLLHQDGPVVVKGVTKMK